MKVLINKLHKAFDNRIRLGIMSALAVNESLDFNALKELLDLTDGNLANHLRALENVRFIEVQKKFIGKKPNTSYFITKEGRIAFHQHLEVLEQLIESNRI